MTRRDLCKIVVGSPFMLGDYPLETRNYRGTLNNNRGLDGVRRLRYTRRWRRRPVTVCIAAICKWNNLLMIVGASDRMLTAGDIEFEPPQTKIFASSLPPHHHVILTADDASVQATLCADTLAEVLGRSLTDVEEVAQVYARHFAVYRRKQAVRRVLDPLGLDISSFMSQQRDLPPDLISRLIADLRKEELGAEAIVTGVDTRGAHIYAISDPGHAACHDGVGFGAIGIGAGHAESQFMFAGYTKEALFPRALLLTYMAKKRAQVAPGVGLATDMFFIGPGLTPFQMLPSNVVEQLDQIYLSLREGERNAANVAYTQVEGYVQQLLSAPPQAPQ